MTPIHIAIIGLGKIARDQHIPALSANADYVLAATVSPDGAGLDGVPHFASLAALWQAGVEVDAVALCTPPQRRYALAAEALSRGVHVFLEKPPGATLAEVDALAAQADAAGLTLFASWHSRFAAGVEPTRDWLADKAITNVSIVWREDVRVWHPGQAWIWQPGGLGVFDPGINALSIVTHILPRPFFLKAATLIFPANRDAPIAADLQFQDSAGVPIAMDLDWRQTGPQSWDIIVETAAGTLTLSNGGARLSLPNDDQQGEDREYSHLYTHFAALIAAERSDVDCDPLRLVADAFLCGRRVTTDAFHD